MGTTETNDGSNPGSMGIIPSTKGVTLVTTGSGGSQVIL
jgi:hypothetical protein